MTPDETIAQQAPQDNPKWFGPSEWLDQLMRCQNGDTTCMRTLQIIERETVSMGWVHEQHANLLALCHAIERLPAGEQQTVLSIQASAIAQEMQRVIQFVYAEQDRPKAANVAGVSIEDGKYTIQMDGDGRLRCLRYGQEWRDLTGDKMALAFAQEVQSLRADLAREKERADSAEKRLAEIAGSTIRVVLTRREYDEYLSLKARADALEKELAGSQTHCRAAYRLAQEYGYSQFSSEPPAEYLTRMLRVQIGNSEARAQSTESRLAALQGHADAAINAAADVLAATKYVARWNRDGDKIVCYDGPVKPELIAEMETHVCAYRAFTAEGQKGDAK